jgi:signal transduction histidine kinase
MPALRLSSRPSPLWVVALGVLGLVSTCRALGFGEGIILGATPASGLALGAAVVLRTRGAVAAAVGFALAGSIWGLSLGVVATDAVAHGTAALVAAFVMRALARRRELKTKTIQWLIFLVGVSVFTAVVAAGLLVGGAIGALGSSPALLQAPFRAVVFEPFGILTFGAVLASLGEFPGIRSDPRPALGVLALGAFLLTVLWLLLSLPMDQVSPSGVTLLLSVPFCLWVAMQRRSLDGAVLSFLAAHVGLFLLLRHLGLIDRAEYITSIIYLNLLVATCQLVHAVNLDRLAALAEVEARKRDLEERVVQRTARLNAMTERALAADAAKTRFLATVSHEVRTPLNGVLGMASVVLAGPLDPESRRNVEIIRTSGYHMLDVINRILDFSKLERTRRSDDISDFDLHAVVEEVLQEARFLPADGIDLRVEFEPDLQHWRKGYRQGLRQVLTNLVGNGAKFTAAGSVTVRAIGRPQDGVRFEVEDTGSGIAPSDLERIFLPYEQAEGPKAGGTGLGLAICAEVVERMDGTIGVESSPGGGSLFWFEVPLPVANVPEGRLHRAMPS